MGFIEDIEHIAAALTKDRQTVMFSATFAGNVGGLAQKLTHDAKRIDVASHTDTHENITQILHWADSAQHKYDLLNQILCRVELEQAVVFTSTQRDADWLADKLFDAGHGAAALHGGMPQGRRTRVLNGLRRGELRILIATDANVTGANTAHNTTKTVAILAVLAVAIRAQDVVLAAIIATILATNNPAPRVKMQHLPQPTAFKQRQVLRQPHRVEKVAMV
jgi:superfamily II helicase